MQNSGSDMISERPSPSVSFEFFPPATPEMAYRLWNSAMVLGPLGPSFVSVTYGAGGGTRRRTLDAVKALRQNAHMRVAGHLTCVGASRQETLDVAREYKRHGLSRIVALRGDPPKGADGVQGRFEAHPDGFASSPELIEALVREVGLPVAAGCYPEPHPEAADAKADVLWLKRKQDAGADMAISQFFFRNDDFLAFRDRAVAAGVTIPIIPGVLPIENFAKMTRFAAQCGATVPDELHELFGKTADHEDAAERHRLLATSLCVEQCDDLLNRGGVSSSCAAGSSKAHWRADVARMVAKRS